MTDRRWYASIPCYGLTALFFPAEGETPTAKQQRVNKARELCMTCPHRTACNELAGPADNQGRHHDRPRTDRHHRPHRRTLDRRTTAEGQLHGR